MSVVAKFSSYLILFSIIIIGAYGVKIFILDSGNPENPQNKITIRIGSSLGDIAFYDDNDLPVNLNYSKIFVSSAIYFSILPNITDYANGTIPEKTVKTFQNISSLKEWLDTINMLNIARNQFKWMLDSSKEQIISAKLPSSNISGIKSAVQFLPTTRSRPSIYYYFKLVIEDDASETRSLRQIDGNTEDDYIWELVVKKPVNSTDYKVTLTRMPKT